MITSNAQIRDGHQLSSMNQRESNAPQSLHCKSKPWDNISRRDRGGVEQTNHSDKGLSLKTPRLKRNNCHGSLDQWFGSHPTGIFSNKKNIKNPENFKGFLILNPSNHWTHIQHSQGPLALWEFTSRCQAKGACHRRRWVFPRCGQAFFPTPHTVKREIFSVLKCGRKWLFTTRSTWCIILRFKAFTEI